MDKADIRALAELNRRFYESNWEDFSATRVAAWSGWLELSRLASERVSRLSVEGLPLRVLDVACGNLRFERFLSGEFPKVGIQTLAIDTCDELVFTQREMLPANVGVHYEHVDVIDELAGEEPDVLAFGGISFDLAVSFGFMHHVPGSGLRMRLLRLMADALVPDGLLAVSLWRFMDDEQLAERARRTTAEALGELGDLALEQGDCILGWNDQSGAYRYCHSFDDAEVDRLSAGISDIVSLAARYRADGRTGALNEYLVFRRA